MTERKSGQVEKFFIDITQSNDLIRAQSPGKIIPSNPKRATIEGSWGDRIKLASDVLAIQVHSVYLDNLPPTLTGSHDIVLFADVWENAAADNEPPLTKVVYSGKNQMIPGKLNFDGNLAYGPTSFKGHPIKIRFTLMVLQKSQGDKESSVPDVISKYTSAIPVYGVFVSQAAAIIRDVLRAQPDVVAFDYETTMLSDGPEKLSPIITDGTKTASPTGLIPKSIYNTGPSTNSTTPEPLSPWGMDDRFGWLQYGFYALVETQPRTNTLLNLAQTPKQSTTLNSTDVTASSPYKFDPAKSYCYDEGWVLEARQTGSNGISNAINTRRLAAKYIVFSITPKQLPEGDAVLLAASKASSATLQNLTQTQDNINSALNTINQGADMMGQAIISAKAQSIANHIAKQKGITPAQFTNEFQQEWQSLMGGLGSYWRDPSKSNELGSISQSIFGQYKQIFNTLNITNTASNIVSSVAFTNIANLVSNANFFAKQAETSAVASSTNYDLLLNLGDAIDKNLLILNNDVAAGASLLLQLHTNATELDGWASQLKTGADSQKQTARQSLTNSFIQLTNNANQISQLLSGKTVPNTNDFSTLIDKTTQIIKFAELSQNYASNAIQFAHNARDEVKSAQIAAADSLRNADKSPNLNSTSSLISTLADLFGQVEQVNENVDLTGKKIELPLTQAKESRNKASTLLASRLKISEQLHSLTNSVSEATTLVESAKKQLQSP
jgi:hypothetical protein